MSVSKQLSSGSVTVLNLLTWSSEFDGPEDKGRALSSSEELCKLNYLVSPALTPTHLTSWVAMTTPRASCVDIQKAEDDEANHTCKRSQVS